jgi:hypothetical protein
MDTGTGLLSNLFLLDVFNLKTCEKELHSVNVLYLIQPYVVKFVSDLRQVGGLLWILWFLKPKWC